MRYIIIPGESSLKWHVWDTLQHQYVRSFKTHEAADDMAADLNEIHEDHSPSAPLSQALVDRVKLDAAVCDIRGVEMSDAAERSRSKGMPIRAKEQEEESARLRQRSRDLYALLKAAGAKLEG